MSEKYVNPDFIINEESPRIPDRDDLCLAHERALSLWPRRIR